MILKFLFLQGYLGHVLVREYGYRVTGLECEDGRVHGAAVRMSKDSGEKV